MSIFAFSGWGQGWSAWDLHNKISSQETSKIRRPERCKSCLLIQFSFEILRYSTYCRHWANLIHWWLFHPISILCSKLIKKRLACYAFIRLLSKNLKLADKDISSEEEVAEKSIAEVPINAACNYQGYDCCAASNSPNLNSSHHSFVKQHQLIDSSSRTSNSSNSSSSRACGRSLN